MKLPAYPALEAVPALKAALREQGRAVLAAPPGSGKTTTIPLVLLDEPWLKGKKILLLEPRRVAARAAAARMAQLLGEKVGDTVGYQIRFERRIGPATRIEVVTEGLLTRRLQADPELPGVGLVIFDEFHERSLDADLALALALDARENLNPDLRLLVMSATLDTQRVAALLDDAPIVTAGGTLFTVDVRYRAPRVDMPMDEALANAVLTALGETEGDILAFLPGTREIRGAQRRIEARTASVVVRPLYGELSSVEQDLALAPDMEGQRKVILATNIAQTSLTVEGVTTVIDAGYVRFARFDLGAGANVLETRRVSRASADQRTGRAGRLGPGTAYRLWSQEQHGRLIAHDTPEMLSTDLSRMALDLAAWGVADPQSLRLLDPPPAANWRYARDLLTAFGALDAAGRITAHGRALGRLPTSPRLAHLLLTAQKSGQGELACWLAAALEEREAEGGSDLAERMERLQAGRGDPTQVRRVREAVKQFERLLESPPTAKANPIPHPPSPIPALVSTAFPERLAQRRDGSRDGPRGSKEIAFLCADGGEARLPETDPLARSEWLAIAHWGIETDARSANTTRRIRLAAAMSEAEVRQAHGHRIVTAPAVHWDAQTEAVVAETQTRLGAIVLAAKPLRLADADTSAKAAIAAAMIDGIRSIGLHALPWTDAAREWCLRVQSLMSWQPEANWPDTSDEGLLATLPDWLSPYLDGISRRSHLDRLEMLGILNSLLDYPQQQALAKLAPTHLTVPTGNRYALAYTPGQAPALEVKLQEMFGEATTPTVCDGRVRVVLHLLSPGRKPIAVTADLASFWAKSYFEVKKDLRGRYPRHPWPDDPLAAQATARAKPRGT
ncbi:MAG: ATP-dependent helicase HrpB [Stagnimonas sp.]|nr:ATP-dependent helicase HrpB [Stagnimonas sp.]